MARAGSGPTFENHCTKLKPHPSVSFAFHEQIGHILNLLILTWLTLESPGPLQPSSSISPSRQQRSKESGAEHPPLPGDGHTRTRLA